MDHRDHHGLRPGLGYSSAHASVVTVVHSFIDCDSAQQRCLPWKSSKVLISSEISVACV